MKTTRILLPFLATAGFLAANATLRAQPATVPVVTVSAPDAVAAEPDNPGVFRLLRDGPTNLTLQVYCVIGGTAENGADYRALPNWQTIPAGVRVVEIPVIPIDDNLAEDRETVILRLAASPIAPPVNYRIGIPSNAVVVIEDNDPANRPPEVRIVAPTDPSFFPEGADIPIAAHAGDADGYVATVEFFANGRSLGIRTNNPIIVPPINPFLLAWSNAPLGEHVLTALATDNAGATALSAPVRVIVFPPPPVVTVRATDARASEPGVLPVLDPGVFTITRSRGTNLDLAVRYSLRGTAVNGVDYRALPGEVTIPRGAWEAQVVVHALPDNAVEGVETVVLRLEPIACPTVMPPPPECYLIGEPREAVVEIADTPMPPHTNQPPRVRLMRPADGMVFRAGANIGLVADTVDLDGYVGKVEFFANTNKLGEEERLFFVAPPPGTHIVYEFLWSNAPPGRYLLTALATDNDGATTRSEPVRIGVLDVNPPPPPPPTNAPALVSIVALDALAAEGTNCWHPTCRSNCWAHGLCLTNRPGCHAAHCRPNVAIFAVRRTGSADTALDVHYAVGGTASNGVDYAELPGRLTIPEGERAARIVVLPIDDDLVERLESVVIGLRPPPVDPGARPTYLIGAPARAAATIVDNDRPRPGTGALADGLFHLQLPGTDGMAYAVQVSEDMVHWETLFTNVVTEGAIHFVDPDAPEARQRFYRAVQVPEP